MTNLGVTNKGGKFREPHLTRAATFIPQRSLRSAYRGNGSAMLAIA